MRLEIGALCPKLSAQLKGVLPHKKCQRLRLDSLAASLAQLYCAGLIPEAEFDRAGARLIARINKAVQKHSRLTGGKPNHP